MVMSDRIALLRSGELEQIASPREIYNRPATAYVAQFIGHTNLLKGECKAGVVHCGAMSWQASLPDGPALLSLRPEHLRFAAESATPGSVRVHGRIVQQAFHGAMELVRIECAGGLTLTMRTASDGGLKNDVDLEFLPADAIPVRESPEGL